MNLNARPVACLIATCQANCHHRKREDHESTLCHRGTPDTHRRWCAGRCGQHAGDVWVGRTSAGRLTVSPQGYVPKDNYSQLGGVNGPFFWGWSDDDPGFDRVVSSEPDDNVYPLAPGASIWLELIDVDPAFMLIGDGFDIVDEPGESTYLGDHQLHEHPTWVIDSRHDEYDPDRCTWYATFVLHDHGAGYASSKPLAFGFANVSVADRDFGDYDNDGDVDRVDHDRFAEGMSGPGLRPDEAWDDIDCEVEYVISFDCDGDRDLDLIDFAMFQNLYGE